MSGSLRAKLCGLRSHSNTATGGPISEVGIENLLQMFGTCAPEGTLTLMRGDEDGLLSWRDGTFEFHARADADAFQGDPFPLSAAVLDALCLLDESQRSGVPPIPLGSSLQIDLDKVNAARGELSQAEEAVVDLASVGMSVSQVIDVIPRPDEEIRQQIAGLLARGLIHLVD